MERRQLKPVERQLRSCGHPEDCTLELITVEGVVKSYCVGCIMDKIGLLPVAKNIIICDACKTQFKMMVLPAGLPCPVCKKGRLIWVPVR